MQNKDEKPFLNEDIEDFLIENPEEEVIKNSQEQSFDSSKDDETCSKNIPDNLEQIINFELLSEPIIIRNRYRLVKKVGEGGTSNVYRAFDSETSRYVALKIIKKESKVISAKQRFKLEGQTLMRFSKHQNILSIFDYFLCGEYSIIVMEYLRGKTLKKLLKEKKILSIDQTLNYIFQILSALEVIHGEDIMHRDLKPQNINIDTNDVVKLMDFGIIQTSVDQSITQTNYVVGSVEYMAPEILKGNKANPRSEVYSLGIMMYSMLTGVVPLKGVDFKDTAKKHLHEQAEPLTTFNPILDFKINDIVLKMISSNDHDRHANVEELIRVLNEYKEWKDNPIKDGNTIKKYLGKLLVERPINNKLSNWNLSHNSKITIFFLSSGLILLLMVILIILFT